MRASSLDRKITIQRKAKAGDSEYVAPDPTYGTQRVVWVPLVKMGDGSAEIFAAQVIEPPPSRAETTSLGAGVAKLRTRILLRYRDDIDSTMRVLLHGDGADVVYQIIDGPYQVASEGRKTEIEISCERYSS